ncbi:MAG: LuxR C-terminal-related transcriptional regulator [Stenotrophobium sp.]
MPSPHARSSIVAAKLYSGAGTGQSIARPQLDPPQALIDGEVGVVLICAPAGYGKSTVMTRWQDFMTGQGVACAWLSLDQDDNDSTRFLRHLVAAFQNIHRDIGRDVLAQLDGAPTGDIKALLESLAVDLGRVPSRGLLFLDDLHSATQPEVREIVHWLINYSPRQFQYVLAGRQTPNLPLSGLRVRRRLLELGTRELQFNADEAAHFLAMRVGGSLAPDQVRQLMHKTEGWAAALELVAAALRTQTNRDELIQHFTGTDRSVVDYLGEMVLTGLGERLRGFVLRIAQFDRINAALAARVAGDDDAARLLADLQTRNLFLIPLDRHGEWFRFHHLVGHFFREQFRRGEPAACDAVVLEGARWLYEQGHIEEAINCAIRAQAWAQAVEWVAQSVEDLVYRRGYHQTLMHWMQALPEEWVDRFPTIRINYAFALAFHPQQRGVEAQLHRLEKILARLERATNPDLRTIAGIRRAVDLQIAISHGLRDEGFAARDCALAWMQRWPEAPAVQKGHMANVLGFGHKTASDIPAGLEVIAQGRQWHEQSEGYYGLAWNIYIEALLHMKRGAYREARQVCQSGLQLIAQHLNGHRAHTSLLHTVLAAVAYEFDEADQAQAHIEQSMHSVQDYGPADAVILAYLTQARLRFLQGDTGTAYAILHEAQALGARRELERVVITLAAEECTWLGREGCYDEAQEVAMRCGILRRTRPGPMSSLIADKSSRVALRIGVRKHPEEVLRMLGPALEHCTRLELHHRCAELHGLKAIAHKLNGDIPQALQCLDEALSIAAPRQYLRIFLDEGREIGGLLEQMSTRAGCYPQTMPLIQRLLRALGRAARSDRGKASLADGLFGELTKREVKLLKHLESGMSNKEIAESVFITEGTLKWHLTNIYAKLGAKNRSGALVKARSLALI